ncbi:MupG family TIM beta-alpha barrel fold protein [Curtobacterium sp. VKM Ac-2922]|uniref:MupG family TIM beta-alpha barrel fold protein n=1 Tax=Curtobacterium sp. VKM Ac-2922 TaxID=2929475 RepID=UPI001FB2235E|nr:MupG family TIM beta-alpha barrel fold protein [Curtobacterium sp. VKM Ac-2922]MCJ1715407.1 MupG family TIM beta-alpha barrel fold protein [Curtobacterium sp. VKM Ac-2922]
MRLGASAYLAHTELAGATFSAAESAGATLAFTSLHIPEDSPAGARAAATAIVSAATASGLAVVADVSPNTARLLGDSPWEFLRSIGVARVRIDFGFSVAEIRAIAAVLPIALNASTLRAPDLAPLADLDVELIHNFYPREWTGLALASVASSVSVAQQFGWRVGAFIAGDSVRRGPLGEGLPTVEQHRTMPPLFQALELVDAGVDDVYVGDPALTDHSWERLGSFVRSDVVVLDGVAAPGVHPAVIEALAVPDRNRPDAAEAMIRLEHSRERFAGLPLPEVGGQPRPAGSVTVQLASAGRYCGEVAITLWDLPCDDRVAVLGAVPTPLLSTPDGAISLVLV